MSFQIPLHFEDLSRSAAKEWQILPLSTSLAEQLHLIQVDPSEVLNSQTAPSPLFASLHSVITRYCTLSKPQRTDLVNIADALATATTPNNPQHAKIALYFLSGLAVTASAVTPLCKYWEKVGRESLLEAIARLASSIPASSAFSPSDMDQISSLLVRTVLQVLEVPTAAKDKAVRPVLSRILAAALTIHPRQVLPAITALSHALNRHEHLPAPVADILFRITEEHSQLEQFVSEFVREISRLPSDNFARDPTAARGCAAFIGELAERLPNVFRSNLAVILSQLDGDSYIMRNGVVHVIGALIRAKPDAHDPLLDVLMERAHRDIHAFTRSKALQTWIVLVQNRMIPNRLYAVLADMAASRLDDKTAAVRKYAAQLLKSLLLHNPFGPSLNLTHFKTKLDEMHQHLDDVAEEQLDENEDMLNCGNKEESRVEADGEEVMHELPSEGADTDGENAGETEEDHSTAGEELQAAVGEADGTDTAKSQQEDSQEVLKRKYYTCAVAFIRSVESGLATIYNLLRSKSITDVSEAVSLLITAVQFQLEAASGNAVRRMLPLVLSRENNIRSAARNAYVRLLAPGGLEHTEEKESAIAVATGLAALGLGATTGELACLEELIRAILGSEDTSKLISSSVIAVLWDIFAGRVPGASAEQRRASCILVGMIAGQKPESLQQRVQILESVGLTDALLARWSCTALCKLPEASDTDGKLSQQLSNLVQSTADLSTVEQALSAIFAISAEPEAVVGSLIRDLARNLHDNAVAAPVTDLARFLQVIGHVAVKELVRIEGLISKLRRAVANQARDDGDHEDEERASAEADKALQIAERELVSPSSLLGRYGNLAKKIASDRSAPAELQASAVLCLAKLMCVEEKFCDTNLRLLFSILTSAPEPLVRANAVTAMGDLAFRFPNLVEPWNPRIYAALQDEDVQVRKNTLMALTHLVLNDMVKVKGQLVGLALCILDSNERIADLARLFFHELARKSSNAIYNILPDTISCMSQMEDLKSDDFKTVVSFLMALMDKERHADGMVEKLCHRFRTNETERENRDLAYCISQLNISERGVRKMNDQFKSFSSALCDDIVHGFLMQAINKGNKNAGGGQTSPVVEELRSRIEAFRKAAAEADEEERSTRRESSRSCRSKNARQSSSNRRFVNASRRVSVKPSTADEGIATANDLRKKEPTSNIADADVEQRFEDSDAMAVAKNVVQPTKGMKTTRPARQARNRAAEDESEEESNSEIEEEQDDGSDTSLEVEQDAEEPEDTADEEQSPQRNRESTRRARRRRHVRVLSDSEGYSDDEEDGDYSIS